MLNHERSRQCSRAREQRQQQHAGRLLRLQNAERKNLNDKFRRRLRFSTPRGGLFTNTMESYHVNAVLEIMESYNVGAIIKLFSIKLRNPRGQRQLQSL